MGKKYYHLEEIAGKTLPLYARLFETRPEFGKCYGWTAFTVWILLLFFYGLSTRVDKFKESVIPLLIREDYLLTELLKTVELPNLVAFLAIFMYLYTPLLNDVCLSPTLICLSPTLWLSYFGLDS